MKENETTRRQEVVRYDFDEVVPRRGTGSVKWDSAVSPDVLPMWVADMDFRVAPPIVEALRRRVEHGVFGYVRVPDAYYDAVIGWFSRRHGWDIRREWMIYTTGVVPALSAIIKALTVPGDRVLIQPPVYNCFFSSIRNNGCEVAGSPLRYEGQTYRMDYEDLERKAADPRTKLLLLCNPHNPAGRVWTRGELETVAGICERHGVWIVSDEIHCELTMPGYEYVPFGTLPETLRRHSVSCVSASKSFNIAGLQIANIIAADEDVRRRIDKAINVNEICDVNPFGVEATIAAYTQGGEWLRQLCEYVQGNYECMRSFCREHLPDFPLTKLEGTYLVWMDCRRLRIPSAELEKRLLQAEKLWLNAGTMYGAEGEGFMRWNIACPRASVEEGLRRFLRFVRSLA